MDVLLDATRNYEAPLTLDRLCRWQAALFPTGQSGLRRIRTGVLRGKEPMQVVSQRGGRAVGVESSSRRRPSRLRARLDLRLSGDAWLRRGLPLIGRLVLVALLFWLDRQHHTVPDAAYFNFHGDDLFLFRNC